MILKRSGLVFISRIIDMGDVLNIKIDIEDWI